MKVMENLEGEIWKPIIYKGIDYTGHYEVSNMGRVKSLKNNIILKNTLTKHYMIVKLCLKNNISIVRVHKLVVSVFERYPDWKKTEVIDHINSVKTDNRLCNLRIITIRANSSKEKTIKSNLPCGVCYVKKSNRIRLSSKITINGRSVHLGRYDNIETASKSYKIALSDYCKSKQINEILSNVDSYRESIGLSKIKRQKNLKSYKLKKAKTK